MLFNEPKLLKYLRSLRWESLRTCFSALQRAEIAEMEIEIWQTDAALCFSALQRAEIAEIFSFPS